MKKVLTLLQPWATLVVIGAKRLETRSWDTRHRGDLLIHASANRGSIGKQLSSMEPFNRYIDDFNQLPFGAIIGKVKLYDTVSTDFVMNAKEAGMKYASKYPEHNWEEEHAFGDFTALRFAWLLEDPIQFETPVPAKGSLGLWNFPEAQLQSFPITIK